jgi:hypothetical protein
VNPFRKKPKPVAENWSCLKTAVSEPDAHGNLSMTFALRNSAGFVFLVTVDGPMSVSGEDYVLALKAAQARIVAAAAGKFDNNRPAKPN